MRISAIGLHVVIGALLTLSVSASAVAQKKYPERPVRFIVSVGAGGIIDTASRAVAKRMGEKLGQPFVVENRPGAGSNIAGQTLATAKPDGYTLMVALDGLITVNPGLYAKMPFDPLKDFAPVGIVAGQGYQILVASNEFPANDVRAIIDFAKRNPNAVNYASGGVGSPGHIYGELFAHHSGVQMQHIPFRSNPAAVLEVVAGRIQLMFSNPYGALPNIAGNKWKAIAIAGPARSDLFPGLPTIAESGLADFNPGTYSFVLVAPAATPVEIIDQLNRTLNEVVSEPAYRDQMKRFGMESQTISPSDLGALLATDQSYWTPLVRRLGISSE
jgi:tripartite-type tricarboxylate transporter receptor subunit TctC